MKTYNINTKKFIALIITNTIIYLLFIAIAVFCNYYSAIGILVFIYIYFIYYMIIDLKARIIIEEDQLQYIRKNLLYKLNYKDIRQIKIINNRIKIFNILQFKDIHGNKYGVDYNFIDYKDAWMDILNKVKKYDESINNIDDLIKKAQN